MSYTGYQMAKYRRAQPRAVPRNFVTAQQARYEGIHRAHSQLGAVDAEDADVTRDVPDPTRRKAIRWLGGFQSSGDVRNLLLALGVGGFNAPMAIQFAFMTPLDTDPDAPGVVMLVRGAQRGLRRLGYRVAVDGILEGETVNAIEEVSGPHWREKTWAAVLGDIASSRPSVARAAVSANRSMAAVGFVDPSSWGKTSGGSCQPKTPETLAVFKNFQAAANRLAETFKLSKVSVDGILGAKSVNLAKAIGNADGRKLFKGQSLLPASTIAALAVVTTCDSLARIADQLVDQFHAAASRAGAPARVSSPAPTQKAVVATDPATGQTVVSFEPDVIGVLTGPLGLAAAGVAGLLVLQAVRKRRKA